MDALLDNASTDHDAVRQTIASCMGYHQEKLYLKKTTEPIREMDLTSPNTWALTIVARYAFATYLTTGANKKEDERRLRKARDRCLALCATLEVHMKTFTISQVVVNVMDNKALLAAGLESELKKRLATARNRANSAASDATPQSLGLGCLPWNVIGSCNREKHCGKRHSCLACHGAHQVSQCNLDVGFTETEKQIHKANIAFNKTAPKNGRYQRRHGRFNPQYGPTPNYGAQRNNRGRGRGYGRGYGRGGHHGG